LPSIQVADIPVHCYQSGSLLVDSASLPLIFVKPNSLRHSSVGQEGEFGKLEDRTAKIFVNLLAEDGVLIQIYSRNTSRRPILRGKGGKKSGLRTSQSLINAIIYGPEALCEPMGEYLTKCGIFLQDPVQNDRDVVYKNPHILSRSEEVGLISELTIETSDSQGKGLENPHDLFSELSKDDHLSLTEAPSDVLTELYP
jgi:SWI/SNF-related matrix-associated actin-dependent regulator of chromatin subfamily A3